MAPSNFIWVPGQRVSSATEPELGIGIVQHVRSDFISVEFPISKLLRRYSPKSAPLRRALLSVASKFADKSGSVFIVEEVELRQGIAHYKCKDPQAPAQEIWIPEFELSLQQQNLGALEQFMAGQWSDPQAFDLRREGWRVKALASDPSLRGLIGPRVSLLPHQLYIARTVASRPIPRVLLADEVGLGKTIEACLILSSLHRLGRANRILIIVPEALKTQWLAELYRRFNMLFTILDEQRCRDEEKTNSTLSAFESSSQIICTLELLMHDERRLKQATAAGWDLMIIDEAHHLVWNPSDPSPAWLAARHLSQATFGLLLLTATPRQHGLETQFGLLNLVDPERFSNFSEFQKESAHLQELSTLARDLMSSDTKPNTAALRKIYPNDPDLHQSISDYEKNGKAETLVAKLIDRHGPGRVLFRNRRERLKGFPERHLLSYPLKSPTPHRDSFELHKKNPKLEWMLEFIKGLGQEKALFITSTPANVKKIDEFLLEKSGHKRALFHEDMDLVERDRQAAWFADPKGAQFLFASEIGGEGRNFQFCRHVVILDLPDKPDLVEQRIGRLDRIGQTKDIQVHVPYFKNSVEEIFFNIYNEGLGIFTQASAGLAVILERLAPRLNKLLAQAESERAVDNTLLKTFVAEVKKEATRYRNEQEKNFDYLVDINSFNEAEGLKLKKRLDEVDSSTQLEDYMSEIFEFFGIDEDELDQNHGLIRISVHSLSFVENFPELHDEKTITFSRSAALAREEVSFLSVDHPMVQGSLSLLLDKSLGQAGVARLYDDTYSSGALFEFSFILQAPAVPGLGLERYLRPTPFSAIFDHSGRPVKKDRLRNSRIESLGNDEEAVRAGLSRIRDILPKLFEKAEVQLVEHVKITVLEALDKAEKELANEEARLLYLQEVNRSVSKLELEVFREHSQKTLESLRNSELRLDALRMLLCAPSDAASSDEDE